MSTVSIRVYMNVCMHVYTYGLMYICKRKYLDLMFVEHQ